MIYLRNESMEEKFSFLFWLQITIYSKILLPFKIQIFVLVACYNNISKLFLPFMTACRFYVLKEISLDWAAIGLSTLLCEHCNWIPWEFNWWHVRTKWVYFHDLVEYYCSCLHCVPLSFSCRIFISWRSMIHIQCYWNIFLKFADLTKVKYVFCYLKV